MCTYIYMFFKLVFFCAVPPRFVDENGRLIEGAPVNEKDMKEVVRNDNFTLQCEVNANPQPQISWYKNNQV